MNVSDKFYKNGLRNTTTTLYLCPLWMLTLVSYNIYEGILWLYGWDTRV